MKAPLNQNLKSLLNDVKWGKYRIGDLFEIDGTKSLDSNAINFFEEGINFIGRTFENNGIQGKINRQIFEPNKPFTITATVIGNYKYVKFQKEEYYCSQNINKLTPKNIITKWNEKIAYFFISYIQKFVSLYDNQQGGYRLDDIKNHEIKIPTKNGKIDFDLMENYIEELEKAKIKKLEKYLKENGLKNCELTSEEKKVLEKLKNNKIEWGEFRLGGDNGLFEIATGRDVIIGKVIDGNIPLISHQHDNNGITKRIEKLKNRRIFNYKNTLSLADRGVFLATTQNEDFHIGTRVKALKLKNGEKSLKYRLFLVSSINKLQILFTDYSENATDNLPNLKIQLPIKDGNPDNILMENLISSIQKKQIQKIINYINNKKEII